MIIKWKIEKLFYQKSRIEIESQSNCKKLTIKDE
jgi:hypothetical protein